MAEFDTFQVAVKGLHYKDGKLLILKDDKGEWDLPGGRINYGESFIEALQRECEEELGVKCRILDPRPALVWQGRNTNGDWRVDICFKIDFSSFDFRTTLESVEFGYFDLVEARKLNLSSHLNQLKEIL